MDISFFTQSKWAFKYSLSISIPIIDDVWLISSYFSPLFVFFLFTFQYLLALICVCMCCGYKSFIVIICCEYLEVLLTLKLAWIVLECEIFMGALLTNFAIFALKFFILLRNLSNFRELLPFLLQVSSN